MDGRIALISGAAFAGVLIAGIAAGPARSELSRLSPSPVVSSVAHALSGEGGKDDEDRYEGDYGDHDDREDDDRHESHGERHDDDDGEHEHEEDDD